MLLARGRASEAAALYDKYPSIGQREYFGDAYLMGRTYLASRRYQDAAAVLEKTLGRYDAVRVHFIVEAVLSHYLLGQAYGELGADEKAIERYEEFLRLWNDADRELPQITDAKVRLKRLRQRQ